MKKLISCALILSVLSSAGAVCFADREAPIRIDESYRDENDSDILASLGNKSSLVEDANDDQVDVVGADESTSSGFADKLLTAWGYVTGFLKRHSSFFVIAGINTAITAFEYIVGTETANSIKNMITGCYDLFSLFKGDPEKRAKDKVDKAEKDLETAQKEYDKVKENEESEDFKKAKSKLKEAQNAHNDAKDNLAKVRESKKKAPDNKSQLEAGEKEIESVVKQNKELYKTNCAWFEKKVKELKTAIDEGDLQTAICHAESAIDSASNASSATAAVKDCTLGLASYAAVINMSTSVYFIKAVRDTANIADAAVLAALTAINEVYNILTTRGLDKARLKKALALLDTKAKDFGDAADIWWKTTIQSKTSTTKTSTTKISSLLSKYLD